ncbi:MAG: hypothetical protein KDA78_09405 [Planctomycetaceae bacterium]|nr:hypothetical protein [Planctomycetaceae bacterium]
MIDGILQQTTIPILEQVVAFGQKRHQVLAGNIVNIDTPGYRTRDLPMNDFQQALENAVTARRQQTSPEPVLPLSLGALPAGAGLSPLRWSAGLPGLSGENQSAQPPIPVPQKVADYFPKDLSVARDVNNRNLTFHDGANRSIEMETMEMAKNTSMQSFAVEVMRTQMQMLSSVISERVT